MPALSKASSFRTAHEETSRVDYAGSRISAVRCAEMVEITGDKSAYRGKYRPLAVRTCLKSRRSTHHLECAPPSWRSNPAPSSSMARVGSVEPLREKR